MNTISIIEIFTNPSVKSALGAILSAVIGAVLDKYIGPRIKNSKIAKPITIKFSISIEQIIYFALKYLVPFSFIMYLMIADVKVDRWFVFSMSVCFSVMVVSLIRDVAINFFHRLIAEFHRAAESKNYQWKSK